MNKDLIEKQKHIINELIEKQIVLMNPLSLRNVWTNLKVKEEYIELESHIFEERMKLVNLQS